MNKLDLLLEKRNKHGERLTVTERIILSCPDPRLQLEAATDLAAKDAVISALTDLVSRARAGSQEAVAVEDIAAIVDTLTLERARMKDHSSLKHR